MAKSTKTTATVQEQEQLPQEKPFLVFTADSERKQAMLSDLISLDSTPIENAEIAMRELNSQHVSHMVVALEKNEELPPLKVVDSSWGTIVLDGLHRWAAYEKYLRSVLESADPDGNIKKEDLKSARENFPVAIEEIQVHDHFDMLQYSFSANLKHGLPASDTSRSRYALWLMAESKHRGDNPVLSMRKAAEQAGVSHPAVSKMAARIRANNQKMVDVAFVGEDEQEMQKLEAEESSTVETKEYAKAEKHVKNVLKAVEYFQKTDMTSTEMANFVSSFAKETTKEAIDEMYSLLSYLRDAAPYGASPEQKELIQTNVQEPEVFHVG